MYLGYPDPVTVYRLFADDGQLLYVGISAELRKRLTMHKCKSAWFPQVTRSTLITYPNYREAHAAEIAAIQTERPLYNVRHSVSIAPPKWGERALPAADRVA